MKPIHTHNLIVSSIRSEVAQVLKGTLASSIDLRYQAKEAHWNVRGREFREHHKLFDRLAETCDKYIDLFAERQAQLGFTVDGRIQDAVKNTQIEFYPLEIVNGMEHVGFLADRLSIYCDLLLKGFHRCEELEEPVTADLYVESMRAFEEMLWMIEACLGETGVAKTEPKMPKLHRA